MRLWFFASVLLLGGSGPALAKGCIKGAVVGGVAGHYVGRGHAVAGAAVGCVVGHHRASVQARQQRAAAAQQRPVAHLGPVTPIARSADAVAPTEGTTLSCQHPPPQTTQQISNTGAVADVGGVGHRECWLGCYSCSSPPGSVLYVTKGRFLRGPFERIMATQLHRPVTVAGDFQLYFDPFELKFLADGIVIANPSYATRRELFRARHLEARVAPLSLFRAKWRLRELVLADAAIDLEWDRAHRHNSWTFSEKKGGKPLTFPVVDQALLAGTNLRYRDPRLQLLADIRFETIRSADARIGHAVRFAGDGQVRATPFTVAGALLSPDRDRRARPQPADLAGACRRQRHRPPRHSAQPGRARERAAGRCRARRQPRPVARDHRCRRTRDADLRADQPAGAPRRGVPVHRPARPVRRQRPVGRLHRR